jgi:hypothetical protein
MSYKKNAGRRRGVRGMAWLHKGASYAAHCAGLGAYLDKFIADHKNKMKETMDIVLPAIGRDSDLGMSLRLGMSSMFGLEIMNPFSMVGIAHHSLGKSLREEQRDAQIRASTAREATYGVPAFMMPRDNGHRQSREERTKYDFLVISNHYAVPQGERDKWGSPVWPKDVELVDGRHPDAGEWGKLCYRTACQRSGAFYYNIGSRKHYCQECADIINREGMSGDKLCFLSETEGAHA